MNAYLAGALLICLVFGVLAAAEIGTRIVQRHYERRASALQREIARQLTENQP